MENCECFFLSETQCNGPGPLFWSVYGRKKEAI